jgi:5-methylcytosine-specific restriction endonuclease McrA
MDNYCRHQLLSGPRKGQYCGKAVTSVQRCNKHQPVIPTPLLSNTPDINIPPPISKGSGVKRKQIPQPVRELIWRLYLGNSLDGVCYCCNSPIKFTSFHAGHVIPDSAGGPATVDNLRPICASCNLSMGTMAMDDYVRQYALPGPGTKEWTDLPSLYASNNGSTVSLSPPQTTVAQNIPHTQSVPRAQMTPISAYPVNHYDIFQHLTPSSSSATKTPRKTVKETHRSPKTSVRGPAAPPPTPSIPPDQRSAKIPIKGSTPVQGLPTIGAMLKHIVPISSTDEQMLDELLNSFADLTLSANHRKT